MVYDCLANCSWRVEDYGIEDLTQVYQVADSSFGSNELSNDHVGLVLGVQMRGCTPHHWRLGFVERSRTEIKSP